MTTKSRRWRWGATRNRGAPHDAPDATPGTRRGPPRGRPLALCRAGADVHTLTLWAKQAEQFDALCVRAVEPVRDARIELGCFARAQHQIVVAEDQPQGAAQHIQPLVTLVCLESRLALRSARRDDDLIRLHCAGSACQRQECLPLAGKSLRVK